MKIWIVTCDGAPNLFVKCESSDEALAAFKNGLVNPDKFPNPVAEELTMEKLISLAPNEFLISSDTGW